MNKKWLAAIGLIVVLMVAGLTGCGSAGTPSNISLNTNSQSGIWVNAEGKVAAVPDVANLVLGVSAQAGTVTAAQSQATNAMNMIMKALENNGVKENDIKTQQFNISKITRWDRETEEEVTMGFRVTNTVSAKVRDIDKAGTIIDAVTIAGGDLTRIDSISFSIDDPTVYQEQAREIAIKAAKAKAEQMAKLTGVSLGKPTYVSESSYIPGPVYRTDMVKAEAAMAPAAAPTPISAGEQEVTVNVQIAYDIR